MITDNEYRKWLRDDSARRTVLLEIDTTPVRRISLMPYTTLPTDATPNVRYDALIKGSLSYSESLEIGLEGGSSGGYATIQFHNEDGALDDWSSMVWKNREVRAYYGDVEWERGDYRLVVAGVVESFQVDRSTFTLTLKDPLDKLNEPITEQLLGGSGEHSEEISPLTFGECHNVKPLLVDAPNHVYRWHTGTPERLIEVRDNGVIVSYTASGGEFSLTDGKPYGDITASVQGDAQGGYRNRVATLIQRLVTGYGPAANRFDSGDLDTANLNAFDSAHPQPVGLYVDGPMTVVQAVVELANSVGAQAVMSRLGKLRLLKVQLPAPGTPAVILPSDYEDQSLEISNISEVVAGVRLGFCKNWTVQRKTENGVPDSHQILYAQEWLTVRASAPGVANNYRISVETEEVPTLLLKRSDAQAEATRRLSLWSVPRTVFRVRCFAQMLESLELGQPATLYGDRFGLESGKTGQVIGLDPDWVAGRCDVEVLI